MRFRGPGRLEEERSASTQVGWTDSLPAAILEEFLLRRMQGIRDMENLS